ncbi:MULTISPECIES: SDR family NAD(P)-dependent oxidoreductase [unclassified Ruegeria]|uniref:SDR family NAD(P)-dependent oxidoreductase n=1 Tax=unclassified Ruegeria TaxID=2625375 RepID=UPI001488B565|nr:MULTISPECIES: SDR family NAD(P)-dependent oxidoreductase [unclassified Ruegeria]
MSTALIIGASGGIGQAVCTRLESSGVAVTRLSRSEHGLDLTRPDLAEPILDRIAGPFDLVLVAMGALEIDGAVPEKSLRAVTAQAMMDQFALNAVGPALVLKHATRLLPRDRPSVFAVLSARVGSIGDNGLGGWVSYRAAKAAVNQIVHTAAIELKRTHPKGVCVALHPGTVKTKFTQKFLGRHPAVEPAEAAENLLRVIESLTPDQSGGFFDWAGKPIPW